MNIVTTDPDIIDETSMLNFLVGWLGSTIRIHRANSNSTKEEVLIDVEKALLSAEEHGKRYVEKNDGKS